MGKKDITEKTLESYNDVFSDIINVLLFEGKELVKEDELSDALPRSYYKAEGTIREQERDISKYWNNSEIRIANFGIENQTKALEDMPLRIIGYDGASYRDQIKKNNRDRYPVVSVVLYFGRTRWNKAKSLKEAIPIPEELAPYVNDYKLNLFEISYLTDEQVNMFKSDFRYVADYFVQVRKNNNYIPPQSTVRHIREVFELLRAMTGDERIANEFVDDTRIEKEGGLTMGEAWLDRVIEQGMERGKEQLIENALRGGSTPEEISRVNCIPIEEINKIQEAMLTEA